MSDDFLTIKIEGIEKLTANMKEFGQELQSGLEGAGQEVAREVLDTPGLRVYPPATSANQPPTPYYIRGRGTQYKRGNDGRSERYGTQFTTNQVGTVTYIGNRASYAPYLGGEKQSTVSAIHGWRRLLDVAKEKLPQITKIYQAWINRAIKRLGLG